MNTTIYIIYNLINDQIFTVRMFMLAKRKMLGLGFQKHFFHVHAAWWAEVFLRNFGTATKLYLNNF